MIDIKREGIEGVIAEAEVKATLMIVKRQPKEEEDKGQDLEIIHLMIVIEETTDAENQDIQNQDQDQILTQILMKEEGIDVEVLMIIMWDYERDDRRSRDDRRDERRGERVERERVD
mgnify:FL=1